MTCEKFESVMGYHCSPVLMGMKPANLVSFSKEKCRSCRRSFRIMRRVLNGKVSVWRSLWMQEALSSSGVPAGYAAGIS